MKKYIALIICTILLVFNVITGATADDNVIAGRGKGKDSEVTTAKELANVLNYFGQYQIGGGATLGVDDQLFASSDSSGKEYDSATFYNKSKQTSDYYVSYHGGDSSYTRTSKSSMTRELTINFTEDAVLYHSVGLLMERSSHSSQGETETTSNYFEFDMYIYITEDECYIKFNKFDYETSEEGAYIPNITPNMLNKWFETEQLGFMFVSINEENLEMLGELGDYFDEYKFTKFRKTNKSYTLESIYFQEVFSAMFGIALPEDIRGEFTVNLAEETSPKIRIIQSYTDDMYEDGVSANQSSYAENNIVFSYINNTVIDASGLPRHTPVLEDYIEEELE